jgi:hypothetical protein
MAEFDSIVGGLFGASPEGLNIAREQQMLDFASKVATAEGQQPGLGSVLGANVMGARGIRELGGVFGVQDPLMQRVSQQQQLLGGVDFTDLESLTRGAQQATAAGRPDIADALAKKALEIRTKVEERQATRDTQLLIARERIQGQLDAAIQRGADQKEIARIMTEGRKEIAALAASLKGPKVLPASLQKDEGKDLETIDTYVAQRSALDSSIKALTPNEKGVRSLELGPIKNAEYLARNASGNSTPESRTFEALKSAVDTAVNLQVSAEKGVQTDKDVLRFAQALIAAYGRNDSEATLQALKRYQQSITDAENRTKNRVESRRKSQGIDEYGFGTSQTPTNEKKTKTITLKNGTVVTVED